MNKLSKVLLSTCMISAFIATGVAIPLFSSNENTLQTYSPTDETKIESVKENPEPEFDDSVYTIENWIDKASETYAGGAGTKTDPYQISNERELALLSKNCYEIANYSNNKYFVLTKNIVLNDGYFEENGTYHDGGDGVLNVWQPIGSTISASNYYFKKTCFDGQDFEIKGVYVNATSSYLGLFGIATDVIIKNVKLKQSFIKSTLNNCGGIVGSIGIVSEVSNCFFDGFVSGDGVYIGGIVGRATSKDCTIIDCENYGTISAGKYGAGGIIGYADMKPTLQNCKNYGFINSPKAYNVGGITGTGEVKNSVNYGNIVGLSETGGIVGTALESLNSVRNYGSVTGKGNNVGGITGKTQYVNMIKDAKNYGMITGVDRVGGVCGNSESASIINVHNEGKISGRDYIGGISGRINKEGNQIFECINSGDVEGGSYVGGIVGRLEAGAIQYCENSGEITGRIARNCAAVVGFAEEGSKVLNSISFSIESGYSNNEIYANELRHFYVDPRTGKIGLRKLNATASFMGEVTERLLEMRDFKIYKNKG